MDNTENLREQVMISQFEMATGCTKEQSRQILQASRWEYLTALSMFFQDNNTVASAGGYHQHHRYPIATQLNTMCAPCNTPTTPPNFPDALLALQKLHTSDWPSSPSAGGQQMTSNNNNTIMNNNPRQFFGQPQAPKILAPFNPMPPPLDKLQQPNCDWLTTSNESGSKVHCSGISIDSGENRQQQGILETHQ